MGMACTAKRKLYLGDSWVRYGVIPSEKPKDLNCQDIARLIALLT